MMEKSHKKTTIWMLVFQYLQLGIAIAYGIFLLPLYIKYIKADLYGAWLASGNILAWIGITIPDCGSILLQKFGVQLAKQDDKDFNKTFTSGLFVTLFFGTLMFGVSVIIAPFLPAWLNLPSTIDTDQLAFSFLLTAAGTAFATLGICFTSYLMAKRATFGFGLIGTVSSIMRIVMMLIMLLYMNYGLTALGWANFSYGLSILSLNFFYTLYLRKGKLVKLRLQIANLKELTVLLFFTSFSKFGMVFAKRIDYFLITRYVTPETATAFRFMKAIPDAAFPFAKKISYAMMPSIIHFHGRGEMKEKSAKLLWVTGKIFLLCCFIGGGVITFNRPFIGLWSKECIFLGQNINVYIVLAIMSGVISDTLQRYIFALGKIKSSSVIISAGSLINVCLSYIGLQMYGLLGLCLAPLITSSMMAIVFFVKLIRNLDTDTKKYIKLTEDCLLGIFVAVGAGFSSLWLEVDSWFTLFLSVLIYAFCFILLLYIISADIRKMLSLSIKKVTKKLLNISAGNDAG